MADFSSPAKQSDSLLAAPWPTDRAYLGICDVCEATVRVVAWLDANDAYSACEPCYTAMAEAWDALTPDEREEASRV